MAYIGREPQVGNFQVCDAISVVNGQAAYTMQVSSVNVSPETANHMLVSLNGVLQAPTSSYTVSGSTITFASALVTGDVINFIHILGSVLDLGVPSDDTVSTAKIVDDAVTSQKLGYAEATLTDAATITWNAETETVCKVTLAGNRTLAAPTSGTTGQFISILVVQDGTGGRTITWNAVYEFAADTAPTLTTTASLGDLFTFRYNGSKWLETGRNLALTLS